VTEKKRAGSLREPAPEGVENISGAASTALTPTLQADAALFMAATPKPPAPFDTFRLGPWRLLRRDRTGKRAVARCSNCGLIREIGLAGGIPSCGCVRSHSLGGQTFASTVAAAEIVTARRRHRGGSGA